LHSEITLYVMISKQAYNSYLRHSLSYHWQKQCNI